MSHVAVAGVHEGQEAGSTFLEAVKAFTEKVRDRAFGLFQKRGSDSGDALTDWLEAESDLTYSSQSDLVEKDSGFQLRLAVPGFTEKELKVTALPDALVVTGEARHHHEQDDGEVRFCETSDNQLFRRFNLPQPIDVDKVTAQVEKGILLVTAVKAQA